ncbi:M56 family metallopeptidase [uncultured Alteromonas sp.]|jgi:TonB family protein|uniref:M56 family metallopeptidase n=1 Tax=uncultured Alteromonas sp. TaxID=179113 RepID=UPI0025D01C39|nr:M56 family metallopeptidase [uncultured Alteromonas sp.]
MTEWLLQQQGPLCLVLLTLMVMEHFFTAKIGIRLMYKLWWMVPAVLLITNLPIPAISLPANSFTRYVVSGSLSVTVPQNVIWLGLWALGVSTITVYLLSQYSQLARSVEKPLTDSKNTWFARRATTPMLFGVLAPRILLPASFTQLFCPVQQQLVLEHENTHLRHGDHLWNALALTIVTVFWFNPLVWLALRSFRINQELACDNQVLSQKSPQEKLLYAKALVACAEQNSSYLTTYPTFGEKSTMLKRLNLINKPNSASKFAGVAALAVAAILTTHTALANLPTSDIQADKVNLATPVKRVSPVYPVSAAQANQEGFVTLQFDITETGATDNIKVVKSSPAGVFDTSAVKAMEQWQYKPRVQSGKAQRQTGILVQLDFKLATDDDESAANRQDIERIKVSKAK